MKNTRCLLVIVIMLDGCQTYRAVDIARRAARAAGLVALQFHYWPKRCFPW